MIVPRPLVLVLFMIGALGQSVFAQSTGPDTEKRFPPLVIPEGFKATLFACDPLVEYPSVIALGPRSGTVFVAHDYMTGLGTEIVRRDEIRLLEDTDADGYADKSTVYAGEFNSVQGLAFHAGTVFVMHAPILTALRDTNGDGVADERRDLLKGLGLTPEQNPTRLHCANGVTVGHDGWLYLSMGDNGTDVQRPEGDRLVLNGGGILRCRRDGKDLHVFSTGLRNIYDVALDDQANAFVRDNENDGGDYMIRVCHSFHGADHGYPYLYREHPDETQLPLADLGRGSSAGVTCYLETAFPAEYRGNLFCCEWGRAVVRYQRNLSGSAFASTKEIDFAVGAPTDPYGFKPTDLFVDRDGSLLISDWGDGQRPKRGRGRIYRIAHSAATALNPKPTATGLPDLVLQLDSPSYLARVEAQHLIERRGTDGLGAIRSALKSGTLSATGRGHAIWILATVGAGPTLGLSGYHESSLGELSEIASSDRALYVRAQAIRAMADLTDPVIQKHKLESGRGDAQDASHLASLNSGGNQLLMREIVIALGRLRWNHLPTWLREKLKNPDRALSHAAQQALRRCDNWPAVLELLDEPLNSPVRIVALRAIADHVDPVIVDGLIKRLEHGDPSRRQQYAEALARVFKKPGPWVYWGYRPAPRPANTVAWDRTETIEKSLQKMLGDSDREVRVAVLQKMQREQVPVKMASLKGWLQEERDPKRVDVILDEVIAHPAPETRDSLQRLAQNEEYSIENRQRAFTTFAGGLGESDTARLLELAASIEDTPIQKLVLLELGKYPALTSRPLLLRKLDSINPDVRAAAIESLSMLKSAEAAARIVALLGDSSSTVRRSAAAAAGRLNVKSATAPLINLASDNDPAVRSASLESLRLLREPSAVPAAVAGLQQTASHLAALDYLAAFGGPAQLDDVLSVAATNRSMEVLTRAVRAFDSWESKSSAQPQRNELQAAIAKVQGDSGVLLNWRASGPHTVAAAAEIREQAQTSTKGDWRPVMAAGVDTRVDLGPKPDQADPVWLASSELFVADPTRAQFLASSNGTLQVWLNGQSVFQRDKPSAFQPDSDRFEAELTKGMNRLIVQVAGTAEAAQFHVRFRRLGSSADHERIAQFTLQNAGNAERGRELFLNLDKTLCLKCHRMNEQGGRIGPDLTGIGSRFSRIHLIESILEPSRTIAPSYDTITVILADGRTINGVKVSETETTLTLGDDQGKSHEIPKSEIDERVKQPRSTMPDGLEKRLTDREFLDLVTFLVSQKKSEAR